MSSVLSVIKMWGIIRLPERGRRHCGVITFQTGASVALQALGNFAGLFEHRGHGEPGMARVLDEPLTEPAERANVVARGRSTT